MLGKIIANKYRITSQLGAGGIGSVYRAEHLVLDRVNAIKVLHPQLSRDGAFVTRFLFEANSMATLRHENIIPIDEIFEEDGCHYIVMELFNGQSLATLIKQKRNLPLEQSIEIIAQCARGLAYAHAQGIVHRDIKPNNILINGDSRVKMTDFGIAAANDSLNSLSTTGELIGTPRYMSPEQAKNENIDRRTDLYSLGMVFYELITGKTPFDGEPGVSIISKLVHQTENINLEFPKKIPKDVRALISKMLARDIDHRVQHTTHLMQEIRKLSIKALNVVGDETLALSLAPLGTLVDDYSSIANDKTMVISQKNIQKIPKLRKQSKQKSKRSSPVLAVAFLAAVAVGAVLLFLIPVDFSDQQLADEKIKSTYNVALAKISQIELNELLQKKSNTSKNKKLAAKASADTSVSQKYNEAVDKELIAVAAIASINRYIGAGDYKKASQSIHKSGELFDRATELFIDAKQDAMADVSENVFAAVDKLRSQVTSASKIPTLSTLSVSLKGKLRKAEELKKRAEQQYVQAENFVQTANIAEARLELQKAKQNLIKSKKLFAQLTKNSTGRDISKSVLAKQLKLRQIQLEMMSAKDAADLVGAKKLASNEYDTALSLNSRLTSLSLGAKSFLENKRYDKAELLLDKSLEIANQVIDDYYQSANIARAVIKQNKIETAKLEKNQLGNENVSLIRRPSQKDVVAVERLLSDFKLAFEARDLEKLQSITDMSDLRLNTTRAVFDKFTEVNLSVTSYSLGQNGATAKINIDKVITTRGASVISNELIPSEQWQSSNLELIHSENGWEKIRWY